MWAAVAVEVMEMYRSLEVRWFLSGDPDPAVAAWVNGGGPVVWTGRGRRDVYLVLPGVDSLGLKLRGEEVVDGQPVPGRFEVKARVARAGAVQVAVAGGTVTGLVEEWNKWSYASDALKPLVDPLLTHPTRVVVDKERLRRKHDLASGPPFPRTSLTSAVPRGLLLEVAVVRVGEARWWSLAVEAFGSREDEQLVPVFPLALADVLRDCPRGLGLADSRSYPRWLADLVP
jgi:hypothetical protein